MKRKPLFFLFFTLLLQITAGINTYNGDDLRLTSADETLLDEHPFLASITVGGKYHCAGFIYNEYFVVTLANCVDGISDSQVEVIAGQHNLIIDNGNEQRMRIRAITPHEEYNSTTRLNDIALIETARAIVFNSYATFIYINGFDPSVSDILHVIGWGAVKPNGTLSRIPRYATFPYRSECREFSLNEEYYPNFMFCAGSGPNVPSNETEAYLCDSDEGSPGIQLITPGEYYAVGLASKHFTCGEDVDNVNAAIFTKLSSYYSWLFRNAGGQPIREAS